jgi:hypothetical protein
VERGKAEITHLSLPDGTPFTPYTAGPPRIRSDSRGSSRCSGPPARSDG